MTDIKALALAALSALPASVTDACGAAEEALPVITLEEEQASVFRQADGRPYLYEHVLSVQIYARTAAERDSLFHSAEATLSEAGLRLVSAQNLWDEAARAYRKSARFRCLSHHQTICQ